MVKEMPKMEGMKPREESVELNANEVALNEAGGAEASIGGRSGGESVAHNMGVGEPIKMKLEEIKEMYPNEAEALEKKRVLDTSYLKNFIANLEGKKTGFFDFGRTKENVRLLKLGLNKIENPKFQGKFAENFMDAIDQGGEEFGIKYAKAIGNGELVTPVDGVLMVTGGTNSESYMPK